MQNRKNEFINFEKEFKKIMRGYVNDADALMYVICYLCFVDSKLENSPYNSFEEEFYQLNNNSFESFLEALNKKFSKMDCLHYKEYIEESIRYLDVFRFANIDSKALIELLKTKDIYFYEEVLVTNAFGNDTSDNNMKSDNTPKEIIELLQYFKTGTEFFDVGCGNGNTLVGLITDFSNSKVKADGIEINTRNALISKIRLSLCENVFGNIIVDDYLTAKIDGKYSFITINMPFGLHVTPMKRNELNSFNKTYGFEWNITPASSSEWIYVNKALGLLSDNGRIALLTTPTPLFKTGDLKLRKDLVENNLIEYVIEMPVGTYPGTGINYSLIILNNNKKDDKVIFVNAAECVKEKKYIRKIDVEKLIKLIESSNNKILSIKEIESHDYLLLTSMYMNDDKKTKLKNSTCLSDLNVEIMRGFQVFSKDMLKENGKYSIVTISDIDDNGNVIDKLGGFDTNKDLDKYILRKNDILISTKGTRIKSCLIGELRNPNTIFHGNLTLLRINDNRINPVFLKLYLDSERGQLELNSIQTGSLIISINISQLSKISIPLLPIDEQEKIVKEYLFKKSEIDVLSNRLSDLKSDLTDSINDFFEGVKE